MKKFSYISNKRITVGGRVIQASDLSKLNPKTLEIAAKQKVIKEEKQKENDGKAKQSTASKE